MTTAQTTIEIDTETPRESVLQWPGKRLAVDRMRPNAQLVECFPTANDRPGLLLHGDNQESLAWLLGQGYAGKVQLIYIDPPYDSGVAWTSRVRLRGEGATVIGERAEYADAWPPGGYLQFMAERLLLLRELLTANGTLWLHCDHRRQSHLHLLLEEIFGPECFLNTIAWRSQTARGAKVHAHYFPHSTHYIHIFRRSGENDPVWNPPHREIILSETEAAAQFMQDEGGFFRTSHPGSYSFEKLAELHAAGRVYAPYSGEVIVDETERRVYASNGGNISIKYYLEKRGRSRFAVSRAVDNLWEDLPGLGTIPSEDVNYPTQKTTGLLRRIIETGTNPGDLVLDAFVGSGTTVAVAEELGRRWIGCDANWRAVRTSELRIVNCELRVAGGEIWRVGDGELTGWQDEGATDVSEARIVVRRREDRLQVAIESFDSPAVERLVAQAGVQKPTDWRVTVQAVLIDPAYDGKVFRVGLVDAPKGKAALVGGRYDLPFNDATIGPVAVRLLDVAGGELLVVVGADAIIQE
ncbi:MAG: site-specific DNA-methyltransferase [Chloroflexi bacterium]|nr:MAG: site-specific DNA-methyltransferase [Chloroflexota bacterium]